MGEFFSVPVAVVLTATVIATVSDIRRFKISNWLTLSLMISGLIYHGISRGAVGLEESVLGLVTGIAILLVFFLMGGMGAGDVKLMGSAGAWLGLHTVLYVFLASALAAGVYAVVLMVVCGRFQETWIHLRILGRRLMLVGKYLGADDRLETVLKSSDRYRRVIPFAAMMTTGLVFLLLVSWLARGKEPTPSQESQLPGSRPPPAASPRQTPALFPQEISSQEPVSLSIIPPGKEIGPSRLTSFPAGAIPTRAPGS